MARSRAASLAVDAEGFSSMMHRGMAEEKPHGRMRPSSSLFAAVREARRDALPESDHSRFTPARRSRAVSLDTIAHINGKRDQPELSDCMKEEVSSAAESARATAISAPLSAKMMAPSPPTKHAALQPIAPSPRRARLERCVRGD